MIDLKLISGTPSVKSFIPPKYIKTIIWVWEKVGYTTLVHQDAFFQASSRSSVEKLPSLDISPMRPVLEALLNNVDMPQNLFTENILSFIANNWEHSATLYMDIVNLLLCYMNRSEPIYITWDWEYMRWTGKFCSHDYVMGLTSSDWTIVESALQIPVFTGQIWSNEVFLLTTMTDYYLPLINKQLQHILSMHKI